MSHIHFLPIRHHSPSCAYHVQRAINQIRPSHILIEGPSDANPLIPHLLEEDLQLPVAIYSYKTSPQPERLYYPICDYSPEFVAIFTGSLLGAHCSFIDIPSAWMMETRKLGERVETGEWWARGTTLYMERLAQTDQKDEGGKRGIAFVGAPLGGKGGSGVGPARIQYGQRTKYRYFR
ncbi:DUF5682 family protein [Laceyella putida]|uniref:DUF5682 family protein n=1 Tax=Laceyella putida TaxID=110101 RepID=A0ABW2RNC6_9BACL